MSCEHCTEGWVLHMYPRPGGRPGNRRLPCQHCNADGGIPDPWPKPTIRYMTPGEVEALGLKPVTSTITTYGGQEVTITASAWNEGRE